MNKVVWISGNEYSHNSRSQTHTKKCVIYKAIAVTVRRTADEELRSQKPVRVGVGNLKFVLLNLQSLSVPHLSCNLFTAIPSPQYQSMIPPSILLWQWTFSVLTAHPWNTSFMPTIKQWRHLEVSIFIYSFFCLLPFHSHFNLFFF